MVNNNVLEELKKAVLEGYDDVAEEVANKAIEMGIKPVDIISQGIVPGIEAAGKLWKKNEYFQSDIILSAEAFRIAMEIVEPKLKAEDKKTIGTVIIGTVRGDMHNLGKIMTIATLRSSGFQVVDLGEDVPTELFIEKVKEVKPQILGLGCYMTTTMSEMSKVIEDLKSAGLRDTVKVLIGGVPTTQEFADEIGADGWGKDAFDAIDKAKLLMGGI
jgi:5-methyltetrahydrofolate--homocysteine methyltransferase